MNAPSAKPLLLHYHIFKNAGTSFNHALQAVFGDGFAEYDSPSPRGRLSAQEIAEFVASRPETEALSSHQATLPVPQIAGRHVCATILLRDPIARIRSMYAFERRQNADTPGAVNAKRLDFKGYVEWRLQTSAVAICNYQVFFCSSGKDADPSRELNDADLGVAMRNLEQLDAVGVVERYEEFLESAQISLGRCFPGISLTSARENVTSGGTVADREMLRAELGPGMLAELQRRNQLDVRLYEFADGLLSQRLAASKA